MRNPNLGQQYHAVVGNPPYIADKDAAHKEAVRQRYTSCHGKYVLSVPFKELFFDKALDGETAGYVGMITADNFMKREFGTKLIADFFPTVDLTHVIDTSGAYIPGHGTPTVILLGRSRQPRLEQVRAALKIRGEPSTPDRPSEGRVWRSILEFIDTPGSENEFITVLDIDRDLFYQHPWSLSGGGAGELKEKIESAARCVLSSISESIGITAVTGEDDVYLFPSLATAERNGIRDTKVLQTGDQIRDWGMISGHCSIWPYDSSFQVRPLEEIRGSHRLLWTFRSGLSCRKRFGTPMVLKGAKWYEWQELYSTKLRTPLSITFAFVATHNHFVLDRGGKVFKQTAPVIKLPPEATADDHLALLGLLNSSVACFWLKQVCHNKGATSDRGVLQDDPEKFRFEFDSTKLKAFPLPSFPESERTMLVKLVHALDDGGRKLAEVSFATAVDAALSKKRPLKDALDELMSGRDQLRSMMVRWQEELDWLCYELYGLPIQNSGARSLIWQQDPQEMPPQDADIRPYRLKQQGGKATDTVSAQRLEELAANRTLAKLELPEFKRRWFRSAGAYDATNLDDEKILTEELRGWLLTRLENNLSYSSTLSTTAQLTDTLRKDADFLQVAELYAGRDDLDLFKLVTDLVLKEDVPYLSALRYKDTGLRKREQWERTWELQRREDAGDLDTVGVADGLAAGGKIPVPPKYASTDFQKSHYWTLRGKLDVPKERFISYPLAERDSDPSPVIGWAGWDHAQQAQALAAYTIERKEQDGWTAERLTPLLAGLLELLPWLKQWHNEIDPDMDSGLGDFYEGFIEEQCRLLHLTQQNLSDWRPPAKAKGGRKKKG